MPSFKPAYLIHGDDHGRIAERRARLRALAEGEAGAAGVQVLEGDAASPQAAAAALSAMTLGLGRRFVIVDGAGRWRDSDLDELESALEGLDAATTVAFFAREDGRTRAPQRLHAAVRRAGGDVSSEATVRAWELPRWVAARARELGLELEPGAAKALVAHAGERQQRLVRELEKLRLALGPGGRVGPDEVAELVVGSAERRAYSLADALVARDRTAAVGLYLELRARAERLPALLYAMTRRVREALDVVARLDGGESAAAVRRRLRMPPAAAERFVQHARAADRDGLRRALQELADLEVDSRGGRAVPEDTAALRTILRLSG
jgi:DNA polymerase III subunit delta